MEGKWSTLQACKLLSRYFRQPEALKQTELAGRLGVSPVTVYAWKVGYRRPARELLSTIARLTGIPEAAWLTRAERVRLDKLRAA